MVIDQLRQPVFSAEKRSSAILLVELASVEAPWRHDRRSKCHQRGELGLRWRE